MLDSAKLGVDVGGFLRVAEFFFGLHQPSQRCRALGRARQRLLEGRTSFLRTTGCKKRFAQQFVRWLVDERRTELVRQLLFKACDFAKARDRWSRGAVGQLNQRGKLVLENLGPRTRRRLGTGRGWRLLELRVERRPSCGQSSESACSGCSLPTPHRGVPGCELKPDLRPGLS